MRIRGKYMNTKVEEVLKGAEDWCKGCPDLSQYIDIFTEDDANNPIIMAAKLSLFTGYSFEKLANFFDFHLADNEDIRIDVVSIFLMPEMQESLSKEEINWIYDVTKRHLPLCDKLKDFHSKFSGKVDNPEILNLLLIEDTMVNKDTAVDLVKIRGLLHKRKIAKEIALLDRYCGDTWFYYLLSLGDSIPKSSLRSLFLVSAVVDGKDIDEVKITSIFDSIMSKYEKE